MLGRLEPLPHHLHLETADRCRCLSRQYYIFIIYVCEELEYSSLGV